MTHPKKRTSEAAERLAAIAERYSSKPPPKCWLCDKEMECHATGGGQTTWYCGRYIGATEAEKKHFSDSHVERVERGDDDVLWLLESNRRLAEALGSVLCASVSRDPLDTDDVYDAASQALTESGHGESNE